MAIAPDRYNRTRACRLTEVVVVVVLDRGIAVGRPAGRLRAGYNRSNQFLRRATRNGEESCGASEVVVLAAFAVGCATSATTTTATAREETASNNKLNDESPLLLVRRKSIGGDARFGYVSITVVFTLGLSAMQTTVCHAIVRFSRKIIKFFLFGRGSKTDLSSFSGAVVSSQFATRFAVSCCRSCRCCFSLLCLLLLCFVGCLEVILFQARSFRQRRN